ncbi:MAG: flagellar biosynthesis protein FlhF [Deltaproteobacteria bacterium]|nr:MAG: flagellar biosynthesis protein FlhF [Deltaproteobacteria bacterium]
MSAKTYRARSIQAAISRIKEEMGTDAVILATRKVPKGANNPYGADAFEVDAAPAGEVLVSPVEREAAFVSPQTTPEGTGLDSAVYTALHSELVGIKDLLYLMSRNEHLPELISDHPEYLNLYARLVNSGLSEQRARRFLVAGCVWHPDQRPDARETARSVLTGIVSRVSVIDPFAQVPDGPRRRMAAFVGPTGVGKTTTIAKVAARLFLQEKRSVGLISIDSFRVGALEQLKAYATIMGIPCLPAFSPAELKIAAARLRNADVILIDTAGHSHLDEARMHNLQELMAGEDGVETHLVLSASTAPQDMREAAERFARFDPVSYVFTKLDETRRRAAILEQVMERPLPVSFLTNGQKVPEDLVAAGKSELISLVFSGQD